LNALAREIPATHKYMEVEIAIESSAKGELLETLRDCEELYRSASDLLGKARELRVNAIRTAVNAKMSLREIGSELGGQDGLSGARVKQILDTLWTHRVSFTGELDANGEQALSVAGQVIRTGRGGGSVGPGADLPPILKHTVYLIADSDEEAKVRVEKALEGRGIFANFDVRKSLATE
jgi:hypothetical protein